MGNTYDYQIKNKNQYTTIRCILDQIPLDAEVLDVGCATGRFGALIQQSKNSSVDGIDYDDRSVKEAADKLRKVCQIDLEKDAYEDYSTLADFIGEKRYDSIILADVYEHLRSGQDLVKALSRFLKPQGKILISVPNILYFPIRFQVFFGTIRYQDRGIMDRTHIRFFAPPTIRREFLNNGFSIASLEFVGNPSTGSFLYRLGKLLCAGKKRYKRMQYKMANTCPSLFSYQMVIAIQPENQEKNR